MTQYDQNATRVSGDDVTINIDVVDSAGDPQALTDASAATYVIVRKGTAILTKTLGEGISITDGDGTDDRVQIVLAAADTADLADLYEHECEVVDANTLKHTVMRGYLTFVKDLVE